MAKFFIHRPVFAIVIAIVIVLAGSLSIVSLPIAQFPDISPPTVQVQLTYPGADAATVAKSIAVPLEEQVNGADNMIYMNSTSTSDGRYNLTCTFSVGTNPDMANVDVNNRASKAMSQLPQDAINQGIYIKKKSPNLLMVVSLYSPDNSYDDVFLSNYASIQMVDAIARTKGVGDTVIVGQRDYSMRLWINPEKISKLGLTASDIAQVVNEQNILAPSGSVGQPPARKGTEFQYTVNVKGRLDDICEFENMIVKAMPDGSFLRMKDVARVELAAQNYSSFGKLDKNPATIILIYQTPDANAIETAKNLTELLKDMKKTMPPGLAYEITMDSTEFVRRSIDEVIETLRDAIILVLLVVFIFLGSFRATIIPMLAVPVSLIGTFAAFVGFGFSINTLTLFALVLAVGIVVDDAIVVVEAVESHLEKGLTPLQATEKALEEVQGPVIAIALVLCAVFVPVAFMGGITGQLYRQFALTLSISVILSAVTALTLTPALCRMILKPKKESKGLISSFFGGFNRAFGWVTNVYTHIVRVTLRRAIFVLIILFAIWGGTGELLKILPTGFVPMEDQGYFFVLLSLPDGASYERNEILGNRAAEFIRKQPGVKRVNTMGGLNIINGTFNSNTSTFICMLDDWDTRKTPEKRLRNILGKVKAELDTYPEAMGVVIPPCPIPGLGNAGGFQFEMEDRSGHSLDELDQAARDFIGETRKHHELTNVFTGYRTTVPQLNMELDRDKARNLGVPINTVFQSLQIFLGGLPVNDFNLYNRVYKVMIQAEPEFRTGPDSIRKIYVRSNNNNMIPLSTLTKVKEGAGPSLVQRYNMYNVAEITGSSAPGISSGQAMQLMEKLANDHLPKGYSFEWSGIAFQEKLAGSAQALIFLLSVTFVFLFLAAQYESWSIPFSILMGLPIGIFGALMGSFVARIDNNVYTQIGIVMLLGLAAKNAILIVEFAKERYEKEGMSLFEATVDGAKTRFRPILMTSFAFILGVLPLVIADGAGAASRRSIGTAVFAGMLAATSLGIFFIPMLYVVIQSIVNFFKNIGKKKTKKDDKEGEPEVA
jgi:hydrophobe/amphiphile efflux-1 (HAE1) family protein